ncbi:hypothetical protein SAMN05660473_00691 [Arthrobacter sp. 49Tsu3.1M3]|nr:hypothetical protein SAMN05660473_00691 [Arthrobacter sp. 49Tsu3.1M3]
MSFRRTALRPVSTNDRPRSKIMRERLQVMAPKPLPMQITPVVYGPIAAKAYVLFRNLPSWDD